jgi:hypothetical protein
VGFGSCRNNDALNSNEFQILLGKPIHFKTEFYGLTYSAIKLIQGLRLGMATGQRRHRGDVVSLCITLDDDIKITFHGISLVQFYRVCARPAHRARTEARLSFLIRP